MDNYIKLPKPSHTGYVFTPGIDYGPRGLHIMEWVVGGTNPQGLSLCITKSFGYSAWGGIAGERIYYPTTYHLRFVDWAKQRDGDQVFTVVLKQEEPGKKWRQYLDYLRFMGEEIRRKIWEPGIPGKVFQVKYRANGTGRFGGRDIVVLDCGHLIAGRQPDSSADDNRFALSLCPHPHPEEV